MMAGLMIPDKPVGNMYFAAWSHNVIASTVGLSNDLKMGEYREFIPCALLKSIEPPPTAPRMARAVLS